MLLSIWFMIEIRLILQIFFLYQSILKMDQKHLTDYDIKRIVNQYNRKRDREVKYYHEVKKLDADFRVKNNERAKLYYADNKDKVKDKYKDNQNLTQIKCLYRYYKNQKREEEFKIKHNEKYKILVGNGVIVEEVKKDSPIILDFM